jgi:hypothetical protein
MAHDVFFVCRNCMREGHMSQLVVVDRTVEAQFSGHEINTAYEHVCQRCGNIAGISLDYGTLDLGLVRDEQLRPDDFEVLG